MGMAALQKCRNLPRTLTNQDEEDNQQIIPTRERKKFNPFYLANPQATAQLKFYQKFKFISNYNDRFMGRCSVIEELETNHLFLMKEVEYKSNNACREFVQKMKSKMDCQNQQDTLLRIIEVYGKRVDGLVQNVSKCTMVLEYPFMSLKKEYNTRLLKNIDFDTKQIADVVYAAIPAYAFLQKTGSQNDKIRVAHIFIGIEDKQSKLKVIDSDLLRTQSNYQQIRIKGYEDAQCQDIYLAPQQFTAYIAGKLVPPTEFRQKAAVFSLGASILDLCIMSSSFKIYQYYSKSISQKEVRGLINIARKRHGLLLYKLLTYMLEFDPYKRPTFKELEVLISRPGGRSEVGSQLRLSTVKDVNNQYLTTSRHSRSSKGYGKVSEASMMGLSMANRQFCRGVEQVVEQQEQLVHMHEQYTNGSQYIGQKKNDLKHGRGKYIFKDRSYYEGGWKDDMMHGQGQLFFSNGKVEYQGEWSLDEPNGWGILYAFSDFHSNDVWTRYEGQMKNGEMSGRGKLYFLDGTIFEGEFNNGKILGRGCKTEPNGDSTEQEWPLTSLNEFYHSEDRPLELDFLPRA